MFQLFAFFGKLSVLIAMTLLFALLHICFIALPSYALYQNETILVNIDLTISTSTILDISDGETQSVIESAFRLTNDENGVDDISAINVSSNYNYFDGNDHYISTAVLFVYFENSAAYDIGIDKYKQNIANDIAPFINSFETNIKLRLFSELNISNPYFIESATINSFKAVQLHIADQSGISLIDYSLMPTMQPTSITFNPTISPSTSMNPTMQTTTTSNVKQEENTDSTDELIIVAILFLIFGCFIGCCFWYICCTKFQFLSLLKAKRNASDETDNDNKKESPNKRNTSVSIEITAKHKRKPKPKKKTRQRRAKSDEGVMSDAEEKEKKRLKRQRYIDYGSEDDSEREREVEKILKQRKKQKKKKQQKRPQSTKIPKRYAFSSTEEEAMDGMRTTKGQSSDSSESVTPKKKGTKAKPVRYDDDGNRILTTQELLAKYKKKKQRGGSAVDVTDYRLKSKENDNDNEENDEKDESDHPHYKPPLSKTKRKRRRHKRSATVDYSDSKFNQKSKLKSKSQKKKKKRRSSNRPSSAKNGQPKMRRPQTAKVYRGYDDDDQPKEVKKKRRRYKDSSDDTTQSSD